MTLSDQVKAVWRRCPELSRRAIAEEVGCSQSLVSQTVRGLEGRPVVRLGGTGGRYGPQIVDYLLVFPEMSRREVAKRVGCSATRVGQVVNYLAAMRKVGR